MCVCVCSAASNGPAIICCMHTNFENALRTLLLWDATCVNTFAKRLVRNLRVANRFAKSRKSGFHKVQTLGTCCKLGFKILQNAHFTFAFCKSICTPIPPTPIYCKVICRSTPPKATIVIQAANFPYIIQSFVQCVPPDPPSWPSLDTPKGRVPCNRHVHTHLKLSSNTPGYQVRPPLLEPKWLRKDINEYIYICMDMYIYTSELHYIA